MSQIEKSTDPTLGSYDVGIDFVLPAKEFKEAWEDSFKGQKVPAPKPTKSHVNVMIDLETLGLKPDAMILSVGAVVFDVDRDLGEEFYMEIEPETYRGSIDISTLRFWFQQAAKGNLPPLDGANAAFRVAGELFQWLDSYNTETTELVLWANGTDFDIPKLTRLVNKHSTFLPWKYSNVRDYRTVAKLLGTFGEKPEKSGHHNALADAKWQAKHLISIAKNVNEFVELDMGDLV